VFNAWCQRDAMVQTMISVSMQCFVPYLPGVDQAPTARSVLPPDRCPRSR
jgi:hypothetical protein